VTCTDNEKHSFIVLLQSYCRPFFVGFCIYSCDCRVLRLKAIAGGMKTKRANVTHACTGVQLPGITCSFAINNSVFMRLDQSLLLTHFRFFLSHASG